MGLMTYQGRTSGSLSIVMIAHSHLLGGMERHVVALSKAMAENGHQVCFAGPMDGWLGHEMEQAGFGCCNVTLNGMYDVVSWVKLLRFAHANHADVIHGHSQRGARYAAWTAWPLEVPAVGTAHSTTSHKWFKSSMHVIAVSRAVRKFLLSQGLTDEQVSMIHLGVEDIGKFSSPSDEVITAKRPLRLGIVSRVEHLKGHDIAFRAVAALKDRLPVELTVVGDDQTQWSADIKNMVQYSGIADRVKFLGQRSDIAELMATFDVVLAPSRREALSLTLIEAAAAGRAVVASKVGGIPEVVLHKKTGLLFPSEDWQTMANMIERLGSPAVRVAYGMAARAYYEQEFTIDHMREKTEDVYRMLIAQRQKS